jgi:hypothetical protein
MAQVVSHWPLTAEAGARARVGLCGVCARQSGIDCETGFCLSYSVFPCQYHSTVPVSTYIGYHLGDEKYGPWWPQFRDIVSLHRNNQHEQVMHINV